MMNNITYNHSLKLLSELNDKQKIQFFILKSESCPFCDDWIKNNKKEFLKFAENDFDVFIIECDETVPFPPLVSPTLYFYHKNFEKPFIRQSFLPFLEMSKELNKFIRVKNGEKCEDVFK